MNRPDEALRAIKRGTEEILLESELVERLGSGRRLRITPARTPPARRSPATRSSRMRAPMKVRSTRYWIPPRRS